MRQRTESRRWCVKPTAHRRADEECTGQNTGNADVSHRLHVIFGQPQPIDECTYAQQHHAVPVGPLRPPRLLHRHDCSKKQKNFDNICKIINKNNLSFFWIA